jgi:hypothetical protein
MCINLATSVRGENGMPARIVVVHDDPTFRDPLVASTDASGHDVASFGDISTAWDALQRSRWTKYNFASSITR